MEVDELPRVSGRHRNKALAQQRRTRAVELAVGGYSYQAVADMMGYANRGTVYRIVQEALKSQQVSSIDEVRELEATRLDALQAALWPDAIGGDVKAVQMVLKIMDLRAKLLALHPPTQPATGTDTSRRNAAGPEQHLMFDFARMKVVPM